MVIYDVYESIIPYDNMYDVFWIVFYILMYLSRMRSFKFFVVFHI